MSLSPIKVEEAMKDILKIKNAMVMENCIIMTVVDMKVNGSKIKWTDMVNFSIVQGSLLIKETGSKTNFMVQEKSTMIAPLC